LKPEATSITIPASGHTEGKLMMSVLEQVTKIVAKKLDKDPSGFNESTDLQEVGIESLDVIEMIFNLEDEFKIDIPFNANEADTTQMRTVGDIARMVETLIANKAAT
jgi:acyl carrier protein